MNWFVFSRNKWLRDLRDAAFLEIPAEQKALRSAWFSEQQAIAIYETELWIFRKTSWTINRRLSLRAFSKILLEEKGHEASISGFVDSRSWAKLVDLLNRFSGQVFGVLLAGLPCRTSWHLHKMAELSAEKIYLDAAREVSAYMPREKLLEAAKQEKGHALLFERLLKRGIKGRK